MRIVASETRLTPTPDTSGLASMTQAVEFILYSTMIVVTTFQAMCYSNLSGVSHSRSQSWVKYSLSPLHLWTSLSVRMTKGQRQRKGKGKSHLLGHQSGQAVSIAPRNPAITSQTHRPSKFDKDKKAAESAKMILIALGLGASGCGARATLTAGTAKAKLRLIRRRQRFSLGK